MAQKTLKIEITGESDVIDSAINSFVRQHGWTEIVDDKPNPITRGDAAKAALMKFIVESISAYNANEAANAARLTATQKTQETLYGQTQLTMGVE